MTLSRADYNRLLNAEQDLADAAQHARVMAEVAAGMPMLTSAEMDDYLAAPSPLAFWRKRAGKTQAALATEASISQAFLAQLEGGKREGSVSVLASLAKALGVKVDDLIEEIETSSRLL